MENEYKDEIKINLLILEKVANVCAVNPGNVVKSLSISRNVLETKGTLDKTTVDSRLKMMSSNGFFDYAHVGNKNYLFNSINKAKITNEISRLQKEIKTKGTPSNFVLKKIELDDINQKLVLNDTELLGFFDKKNFDTHKHFKALELLFENRTEVKNDKAVRKGASMTKRSLMNVCDCKTSASFYQIIRRLRTRLKKYPIQIKRVGSSYYMEIKLS